MLSVKSYKDLPSNPGCYLYRDINGTVLYVGKAKSLKKRVASYFTKNDLDTKTAMLVKNIVSIDFFVTKNEVEALLLENNLIKKHYPKYNIDLKDSRRYAYLRLTPDEPPYIEVARTRAEPGVYFGPFVSGKYRKEIQRIISRYFGVLIQKPSPLKLKSLNVKEYKLRVKKVTSLLKGNISSLRKSLLTEMQEASEKKHFEHALTLRRQVEALDSLTQKQSMELKRSYDADIINFIRNGDMVYLLLFNMYKGVLENKQEFEMDYTESFLEEFLLQLYSSNPIPKEIIVPYAIEPALEEYLSQEAQKAVKITAPKKGVKKDLLDLVLKNVKLSLLGNKTQVFELKQSLGLSVLPSRIECYDISHLRGTDTVASMVVFVDGKPYKSDYRKFKIQADTNGDDFAAMGEVIFRRFARSLRDTLPLPDLVVIDGGRGQLNATLNVLKELGVNVSVISLAKKLEEVYLPHKKDPIRLAAKNSGLQLLRAIRDEAHRFAITYNRTLRKRRIK